MENTATVSRREGDARIRMRCARAFQKSDWRGDARSRTAEIFPLFFGATHRRGKCLRWNGCERSALPGESQVHGACAVLV